MLCTRKSDKAVVQRIKKNKIKDPDNFLISAHFYHRCAKEVYVPKSYNEELLGGARVKYFSVSQRVRERERERGKD